LDKAFIILIINYSNQHPLKCQNSEVVQFLSYLAIQRHISPNTQLLQAGANGVRSPLFELLEIKYNDQPKA
jgi:hypothetical protein